LLGVDACYFDDDASFVTAFRFRYDLAQVAFYAVEDDDTVAAATGDGLACADGRWIDVSEHAVWAKCRGKHAVWAWALTNQQGYADGIRIEFAPFTGEPVTVEAIVAASAFRLYSVREA
jgi:hypothetical protein